MNSFTSIYAARPALRTTRAQFSPLRRQPAHSRASRLSTSAFALPARLWSPALIDRLQTPLTRHHD